MGRNCCVWICDPLLVMITQAYRSTGAYGCAVMKSGKRIYADLTIIKAEHYEKKDPSLAKWDRGDIVSGMYAFLINQSNRKYPETFRNRSENKNLENIVLQNNGNHCPAEGILTL